MTKNLIIFGAGASKGSDSNGIPPMGNELFEELSSFNPDGWGKIPAELTSTLQQDFEKGMQEISEKHSSIMGPLQRAMAAYFFRFRTVQDSNLYVRLAKKINNSSWDGALATLNYDLLLPCALNMQGISPVVGTETNEDSKIEVCMPHGCCHIFCSGVQATGNISFSGNISTEGDVEIISSPTKFQHKIQTEKFPPVMSYFIPSKFTTSGTNFIKGQRKRFEKLVAESSTIAIIGIQIRPHDQHVWNPISNSSAKIIYCSGSGGRSFKNWNNENRKNVVQDIILNSYWNESFDEICTNIGLT